MRRSGDRRDLLYALALAILGVALPSTGVRAHKHKHHHHNYRKRYRKRCRQHCKDDKKSCDRGCDILDGDSQDFCKQGCQVALSQCRSNC
jgi:hypothetical protein